MKTVTRCWFIGRFVFALFRFSIRLRKLDEFHEEFVEQEKNSWRRTVQLFSTEFPKGKRRFSICFREKENWSSKLKMNPKSSWFFRWEKKFHVELEENREKKWFGDLLGKCSLFDRVFFFSPFFWSDEPKEKDQKLGRPFFLFFSFRFDRFCRGENVCS